MSRRSRASESVAWRMFAASLPPERLPISRNHDPFKVTGLDMRSEHGRRFKDLAAIVIKDHGPDIDPVKIRELAGLKLSIEITQARTVRLSKTRRRHPRCVRIAPVPARRRARLREAPWSRATNMTKS
jgi:hypothetical protein